MILLRMDMLRIKFHDQRTQNILAPPVAQWLGHSSENPGVVGSDFTHICGCGIFPQRELPFDNLSQL